MSRLRDRSRQLRARGLAACVLAFALAGCASQPANYDLRAAAIGPHVARGSVAVGLPSAAPPLDSQLVVVRAGGDQLNSLAGAQWADRLTLLVQSRMVETFENAGLARKVRTAGGPANRTLALDIRRFDIDAPTREARVEISARLIADNGQTVAAKIFSAETPVTEIAGSEPPIAINAAFGRVMQQIVAWTAVAS